MYLKKLFLIFLFLAISIKAFSADWYIATTGNDSYTGVSEQQAVATVTRAYALMSPNDTLIFLDGTYSQQLFPPVSLSGTNGSYTTFKAKNRYAVTIAPSEGDLQSGFDTRSSLYVYSNVSRGRMQYLAFDGFVVHAVGEHNAVGIFSIDYADPETQMTNHIKLTHIIARGHARDVNVSAPIEIMGSTDTLLEDFVSFGYGRKGMEVYGGLRITVRRGVIRHDWWEGDSYLPSDPRTQVSCYNTVDSTFENLIAIDSGPHPLIRTPDRSVFTLSGNAADGTFIQGSSNSGYYGCIAINNSPRAGYCNGLEINGGSGGPATNLYVKDVALFGCSGYGLNVHDNVDGVDISYVTSYDSVLTGIRVNPDPSYLIDNLLVSYTVSTLNGSYGFYNIVPTNSTAVSNGGGTTIEAIYLPTITHPPTNTPVAGHGRGADVTKKYVDRVKTADDLWPWEDEDIIKSHMCDETYLADVTATINTYDGTTTYVFDPGLCSSGKTLTKYVWEYLGNEIPADIYGVTPAYDAPTITVPDDFSTYLSLVEIEGSYIVDQDLVDQSVVVTWTRGGSSGFAVAALGTFSCTVPVELGTNSIVFEIADSNNGAGTTTVVVTRTLLSSIINIEMNQVELQ